MGLLVLAVTVWIGWTLASTGRDDVHPETVSSSASTAAPTAAASSRDGLLLALLLIPIFIYVWGVLQLDWGFNEMSALFVVAGLLVGLVAGWSLSETAVHFIRGMESMLGAALFVGVARSISLVLDDGMVIDTIVAGLVSPLSRLPAGAAAALMVPIHAAIHVPVMSNSGHAVLMMPIMAPTADLLGISRDAAVMAYQTGGPIMDAITPTNGALLAMLLTANVSFGRWLRFVVPGMLLVSLVGFLGIALML